MSIMRAAATVGGMTMISRVLGFIRDVLIGGVLGSGPVADAFVVAFRFPNLFRRFFAEGAFNAAFVPLYAKRLEGEGKESATRFAEEALSALLAVLLTISALAMIFMPAVMTLIAPGFTDDPERFDLAVLFTRIAFPYLLCMSLVALFSGLLNSHGRFAAAAFAPALLNVILIAAIVFGAPRMESAGHALVWGVCLAGFVQLALVVWAAAREGVRLRLRLPRITPEVKRLVVLGVPGIIAAGITQINLVISQIIASLENGAVSILYYADRIYQFPLGLIGVAVGVVLLPEISRRLRAEDDTGAQSAQNRALELSMALTVPAAVACGVIALTIVTILYKSTSAAVLGETAFTSNDATLTALALTAFAFGLPAFVLIKVFQPAYFAREDTKTPMYYAAANTGVNVVLGFALFWWLTPQGIGLVGLAIGTSVAAWVNVVLLARRLIVQGHFTPDRQLLTRLPRIVLASAGMGAGLWAAQAALAPWLAGGYGLQVAALAVLVIGGGGLYGVLAIVTRAMSVREIRAAFTRRAPASAPDPQA